MFDTLQDRLQDALSSVRSHGKLDRADIDKAMREVRLALLEADVNLEVVKQFTESVKGRCLGVEVLESLHPGQQVTKIVNDELINLLGGSSSNLTVSTETPTVVFMVGLQGSGKTTACGKLAAKLIEGGEQVGLVACDLQRPAAVEQLGVVAEKAAARFYQRGTDGSPLEVAKWALKEARSDDLSYLIIDTAGRLSVDQELMDELTKLKKELKPDNILMVLDAMTGQDVVTIAEQFLTAVDFNGVILTKLDGDARGGGALSIKAVTDKPIMFVSNGERLDAFEQFHPDRMASRILAMGDVVTLVEKAEKAVDKKRAEELEKKIRKQTFGLDDFLEQMNQVRNLGPIANLLKMMPGFAGAKELRGLTIDERELDRIGAIITSMTLAERSEPKIIDGSRRRRIAAGSGTTVQAVNQLIKQFAQMQKLMSQMQKGGIPGLGQLTSMSSNIPPWQ